MSSQLDYVSGAEMSEYRFLRCEALAGIDLLLTEDYEAEMATRA
jgi:hypothetical protein